MFVVMGTWRGETVPLGLFRDVGEANGWAFALMNHCPGLPLIEDARTEEWDDTTPLWLLTDYANHGENPLHRRLE